MNGDKYYEVWYEPSTKETFWFLKNNPYYEYASIEIEGINFTINEAGVVLYAEIDSFKLKESVFNVMVRGDQVKKVHKIIKFEVGNDGAKFREKKVNVW